MNLSPEEMAAVQKVLAKMKGSIRGAMADKMRPKGKEDDINEEMDEGDSMAPQQDSAGKEPYDGGEAGTDSEENAAMSPEDLEELRKLLADAEG